MRIFERSSSVRSAKRVTPKSASGFAAF